MAQFDETKVINALHPEKAEVGKKYWFADDLVSLKEKVESNRNYGFGIFDAIDKDYPISPFEIKDIGTRQYLYPYEEPPKQRMTNVQLIEWLAKGNGVYKNVGNYVHSYFSELVELLDEFERLQRGDK